jgi:hypothetical protein
VGAKIVKKVGLAKKREERKTTKKRRMYNWQWRMENGQCIMENV